MVDFGLACLIDEEEAARNSGEDRRRVGTRHYMAPEVIKARYYTDKCDTWAIGIICYKIFSHGNSPFEAETKAEIFE